MAEEASYLFALFVSIIVPVSSWENIWPHIAKHFWPGQVENGVPILSAISPMLFVRFVIRFFRVSLLAVVIALKYSESSPKARMTRVPRTLSFWKKACWRYAVPDQVGTHRLRLIKKGDATEKQCHSIEV